MKGTKQLDQIKEDNKKQLKKLFKYDKDNALTFSKEDREKVQDKLAYMLFSIKRRLSSLVKQVAILQVTN